MAILTANGVALPAPTVIKIDNEIIWSSNTGRKSNGIMADCKNNTAIRRILWQ